MKTLITILLTIALAALPLRAEEEPQPQPLFGIVIVGVAVAIVGTAAYVVYKCDKAKTNADKCPSCSVSVKKHDDCCPGCGVAVRCTDCGTRLAKGAKFCSVCGEKVPPPQKPLTATQLSLDGTNWLTLIPTGMPKLERELEMLRFKDNAEFESWKTNVTVVTQVTLPETPRAFFRLASQ